MSSSSSTSDESSAAAAVVEFDQELCHWLQTRKVQLAFDWTRIFEGFFSEYSKTFARSKKAHFDSLPSHWTAEEKVVDGARAKWCNLLVMDALIYFLQHKQFDLSYRRTFNQQKVLSDCIMKELQRCNPEAFRFFVRHKTTLFRDVSSEQLQVVGALVAPTVFRPLIVMQHIPHPWENLRTLQDSMLREPTSKSKRKFQMIIETLCNHQALSHYDHDVSTVLAAAVFKAIFVFPLVPGGYCFAVNNSYQRFSRASVDDHAPLPSLRPIRRRIVVKHELDEDEEEEEKELSHIVKPVKVPVTKVPSRDQSSPTGIEEAFEEVTMSEGKHKRGGSPAPLMETVAQKSSTNSRSNRAKSQPRPLTLFSGNKRRSAFVPSKVVQFHDAECGFINKKPKFVLDMLPEPDFELFHVTDCGLDSSLAFEDTPEPKLKFGGGVLNFTSVHASTEARDLDSFFLDWLDDDSSTSSDSHTRVPTVAAPTACPERSTKLPSLEASSSSVQTKCNAPVPFKCMLKKRLPEYYERNGDVAASLKTCSGASSSFVPSGSSVARMGDVSAEPSFSAK